MSLFSRETWGDPSPGVRVPPTKDLRASFCSLAAAPLDPVEAAQLTGHSLAV